MNKKVPESINSRLRNTLYCKIMEIYKLGTRWGSGAPDFYEMIKEQKIALSHKNDCSPKKSSVILITLGFTVNAIAILEEDTHPVTDDPSLAPIFKKYSISYDDSTTYAKAKWIELKEDEKFSYKTQDGICQIHKPDIHVITKRIIKEYTQKEKIASVTDLLYYKKQIILQGPPGTGKTRLAKKIAQKLIGFEKRTAIKPDTISFEDVELILNGVKVVHSSAGNAEYAISGFLEDRVVSKKSNGTVDETLFKNIKSAFEQRKWKTRIEDNPTRRAAAFAKYIYDNIETTSTKLEDLDQFKLVQFHPSYTYEDFVRGIEAKPNPDGGEGIFYEAVDKTLGKFAKDSLDNYKLSKAENLQDPTVNNFDLFLSYVFDQIDTKEKYMISDKVYVFYADDKRFRYKGDNWTAHPNGLNMNYSELQKIISLGLRSRQDINKNNSLNALTRQHATYYQNVLELYKKHIDKIPPSLNKKTDTKNYVIIIDEINRANPSSVLGELIYALEYRNEKVESMYEVAGANDLVIPPNLFIIGTMNTADRSVGHIDYAIRRRFAFVDVLPEDLSYDDEIKFDSKLFSEVAGFFSHETNLAKEFEPRDVQLGHSYFIDKSGDGGNMSIRLKYEIQPILLEYVRDGILIGSDINDKINALSVSNA